MSLPDVMLYDKSMVLNSFQLFCLQALVSRMSLLPRLKYILEVVMPQAPTVIHILQILVRVARHSVKLAYQVSPGPKVIKLLMFKSIENEIQTAHNN